MRTVNIWSAAWADTPPMASSSVASTDILFDMVGLFRRNLSTEAGARLNGRSCHGLTQTLRSRAHVSFRAAIITNLLRQLPPWVQFVRLRSKPTFVEISPNNRISKAFQTCGAD